MKFEQRAWVTTLVLLISIPVSAQEYRFHGDSAVDESTEEGGAFSFPPSGYSPYKQRAASIKPRNTVEPLTEGWGTYPQLPYGAGHQPQAPWAGGYGYLPRGEGAMLGMPHRGGASPFGMLPGSSFLLPW